MAAISVESAPTRTGWDCDVEIGPGERDASRHHVSVTHEDLERWGEQGSVDDLVRRSFEFLISREEPHEILKSFALSDITRYFPDFWDHV